MSKLLTISIAAYNVEKTIEECLNSFLPCQHLNELEILVINDGSKDRTVEIVSEYVKKYPGIIYLINKENGGHGSTINKSLSLATGKFFKVIDGDDWINSEEFDKLCDWLERTDSDLVVNAFKWCYPDKPYEEHNENGYILHHTYTFDEMYSVMGSNTPAFPMTSITIATDKLLKAGMHIKEKCFYADNEYVFFCYMATATVSFDSSCAYQYRMGQTTQSVSSEGLYRHLEDSFSIFGDLMDIYRETLPLFEGNSKEKYLFQFLEIYYNSIYMNMVDKITNPGKDYLLAENIQKFRSKNKELFNRIHLTSMSARFVVKNPNKRIAIVRYLRKTLLFKVLKGIKRLVA